MTRFALWGPLRLPQKGGRVAPRPCIDLTHVPCIEVPSPSGTKGGPLCPSSSPWPTGCCCGTCRSRVVLRKNFSWIDKKSSPCCPMVWTTLGNSGAVRHSKQRIYKIKQQCVNFTKLRKHTKKEMRVKCPYNCICSSTEATNKAPGYRTIPN